MMGYHTENEWLDWVGFRVLDSNDAETLDTLRRELETRKTHWRHEDEGGAFNLAELTHLIDRVYRLLEVIDALRRQPTAVH